MYTCLVHKARVLHKFTTSGMGITSVHCVGHRVYMCLLIMAWGLQSEILTMAQICQDPIIRRVFTGSGSTDTQWDFGPCMELIVKLFVFNN